MERLAVPAGRREGMLRRARSTPGLLGRGVLEGHAQLAARGRVIEGWLPIDGSAAIVVPLDVSVPFRTASALMRGRRRRPPAPVPAPPGEWPGGHADSRSRAIPNARAADRKPEALLDAHERGSGLVWSRSKSRAPF